MLTPISMWMLCCTEIPLSEPYIILHISFILGENRAITVLLPNPAVSPELLGELSKWKSEGASLDDTIECLRLCTVPFGYEIHIWTECICMSTLLIVDLFCRER